MRLGLILKDLGEEKKALAVFQRACNDGAHGKSCEFFAHITKSRADEEQYLSKARQIYLSGCNAGENFNCEYLKDLTDYLRKRQQIFSE